MELISLPSAVWFPVVTLVIGAALKAIFDGLSDKRIAKREKDARKELSSEAFKLKRVEFQRATLLDLQETSAKLIRFTGQSHHQDVIAHRQTGKWQKQLLSEQVNTGFNTTQVRCVNLRVRARDKKIRDVAVLLNDACVLTVFAPDEASGNASMVRAGELGAELNERIGEVLRDLDEGEEKLLAGAQ